MSAEVKTTIVRPNIFPECRSCHIALKIIDSWLADTHPSTIKDIETLSVKITCVVKGEMVYLLNESIQNIQFREGQPKLVVNGGNLSPEKVPCPHFRNLIKGDPFDEEPE